MIDDSFCLITVIFFLHLNILYYFKTLIFELSNSLNVNEIVEHFIIDTN
jgi:hypothetical protein